MARSRKNSALSDMDQCGPRERLLGSSLSFTLDGRRFLGSGARVDAVGGDAVVAGAADGSDTGADACAGAGVDDDGMTAADSGIGAGAGADTGAARLARASSASAAAKSRSNSVSAPTPTDDLSVSNGASRRGLDAGLGFLDFGAASSERRFDVGAGAGTAVETGLVDPVAERFSSSSASS